MIVAQLKYMAGTLLDFKTDSSDHPYPIFTRKRSKIIQPPLKHVEEDQANLGDVRAETHKLIKHIDSAKNNNLVIRSVSQHLYSCVGMIFCNRRTWIDPDNLIDILTDDGYKKLTEEQKLSVGDVALYCSHGKPRHIGLVTYIHYGDESKRQGVLNVRVLSKWGYAGEVEHFVNDVPGLCGKLDSYWSDRIPDEVAPPY